MKTSDFNYELPPERIAQTPVEPRHASRLMVLYRSAAGLQHTRFWNITEYLRPGDVLVVNQTRVIPARLPAHKASGGKAEILLLRRIDLLTCEALVGGKNIRIGSRLIVDGGPEAVILSPDNGTLRQVRFDE
ncbi:MAG: S-adenosylmethionine:tRNA ribosyltransferase-isomerase, partial [Anaerolineaceae bacterium]